MGELRAIISLLGLCLALLSISSSKINISVTAPKYSSLILYIAPLEGIKNATVTLNINYNSMPTTTSSSFQIYSSTFALVQKNKYSIWNFEATDLPIEISLASPANLTEGMAWVETGNNFAIFVAAYDKDTSNGFMLPFNMLNQKTLNLYVVAYDEPLSYKTYNLEPFMSTYWTEVKSSIELVPHLPYLSQCSLEKSFILINDLLQPSSCYLGDFLGLQCDTKKMDFSCVLEELEVSNVDSEFWFNKNGQILFYLFPYQFSLADFNSMEGYLKGINTLILTFYKHLIPVYYQRHSRDPLIVNDFQIDFQVAFNQDTQMKIHIVYAEIKGYYNPSIASPNALMHVHVKYLNILERFNSYDLPAWWYIAYAVLFAVVVGACIWSIIGKFCKMRLREKIQYVLTPAVKGCLYTTVTGGCFFVLINQVSYWTNYSSVTALYGDTLADESLQLNNIGRNGLAVAFTGIYLMVAALKQAYKVSSTEQLKIVFEDDSRLERRNALSEEQLQQRIEFTRKNMVSHQKFMLASNLLVAFMGFWYLEFMLSLSNDQVAITMLLAVPFVSKALSEQMKHLIIKELLYVSGNLLSMVITSTLILLKNRSIAEFTFLYLSRFFYLYFEVILADIFYDKLLVKLDAASEANRFTKLLSKLMRGVLEVKRRESVYERAIYMGSLIVMEVVGVILTPLVALVIYLLSRTTLFQSNLLMNATSLGYSLIMLLALMPLQLLAIFALMEVMKKLGVRIQEVIKFNRFRFRRRKFRWMNDEFSHSRNIHFFYREYEKFAFSSQLYFVVSLLGFSGFLLYLGVLIVIQSGYLIGNDPVMLVILVVVVISGDILSIVVSFAAVKLRLYEKKEEEVMRQNLMKTEKYLKNNDITDFLSLEGVKDYFLLYNREWIVHNLPLIFNKEDFDENAGQLIAKYKHYKSLFKKRQIDEKRRIKRLKENSVLTPTAILPAEAKLSLPRRPFLLFARPLVCYWLYLARQSLHLRTIVASVRKDKLRKNCEFCNMDVQLQALQRRDFQELTNEFRFLNVNRAFDPQSFLEFYRLKQKYVTICVECKEKNLHLENKITLKQLPSKLVKRWHLIAKSFLLHRNIETDSRRRPIHQAKPIHATK